MNLIQDIKKFIKPTVTRLAAFRQVAIGVTALLAMTSCSDELSTVDGGAANEGEGKQGFYISLNVKTPTTRGTRAGADYSYTEGNGSSNLGTVDAEDIENQIFSAKIYFVDGDGLILLELEPDERYPAVETTATLVYEVVDINKLKPLVGKSGRVMIVANYDHVTLDHDFTGNTKKASDAVFNTTAGSTYIGKFGTKGRMMPLVNAIEGPEWSLTGGNSEEEEISAIRAKFDRLTSGNLWWDLHETYSDQKDLKLERAVARIEYRDLKSRKPIVVDGTDSQDPETGEGLAEEDGEEVEETPAERSNDDLPANQYWIGDLNVRVELTSLQPFNINKKSYLFRHTAAGNLREATTAAEIFENENGGESEAYNWIANPDWDFSNNSFTKTSDFLNAITVTETEYQVEDDIPEVTIEELMQAPISDEDGYRPFAYVTENTLPSIELMDLYKETTGSDGKKENVPVLTDYATGIAFRFLVLDKKGQPFTSKTPKEDTPTEFGWSTTNTGHLEITDLISQKWVDVAPETSTDANGNSVNYFYLTYIACIVHNNGKVKDDSSMYAPMYYGVVRNNTYQISVNSILGLPLPQDPRTIFLQIECKAKDWNVRWDEDVTLY